MLPAQRRVAALLTTLGFEVDLFAARFHGDDRMEPRFGHLALRVTISGEPWLVDVGAGYSFRAPLRLEVDSEQDDRSGTFRIQRPDHGPVPLARTTTRARWT
ncbi:MAG: arylamine N-acetyltransferase [Candidatus Limnocylindrales bacterium]